MCFFFFKQKTAYDMRISDWSSDVCSSDLEQFIPIAEETGMIADLSLSVTRQALLAARDWDSSLSLSINISPWQLRDPWLAQKIIKLLTETGYPAARLEVEITESALFDNLALAQSIVGSLKNQGISLALDDFGTGYSSLAHLRALPFDRIKIDRSFVTSINDNAESAAIVGRSEEHTSELQSLMRISYAVFCLTKKTKQQ